jgi:hypothetical protein
MTKTYKATIDTSAITTLDGTLGNLKVVEVSVDHERMTVVYKLVVE